MLSRIVQQANKWPKDFPRPKLGLGAGVTNIGLGTSVSRNTLAKRPRYKEPCEKIVERVEEVVWLWTTLNVPTF